MNVIELCGGLGNQLFQYAFGQVQKRNGADVAYSTRWYGKLPHPNRPYRLDKFKVHLKLHLFLDQHIVRENGFNIDYLDIENCNFKGYWQYLDYFKDILPILRNEFYIKEQYHTEEFLNLRIQILSTPSISLHVRRTDYIGRKGFGVLPLEYYIDALELVDGPVYVFSDDMKWCKSIFKSDYLSHKFIFVHLEDYLDFELMRLCKHNISANSTFSYWASLLNPNPDKKVVVSGKWLADKEVDNDELHFPKEWIKL